ncbi:hypothetical protein L2E82_50348 [Cichorium intybus]|nr:hypothetical protein L2E82_50348 [Cichorium intybus]
MAGLHLPGDPYLLEEGNGGWLNEEPEEEPEEVPEEEPEEVSEEEDQWKDEDSDDGSEVIDPRYPVRDIHVPPPPPKFQVYRHPGGPLWMRTPRKRVLPIHRPLLIEEPLQDPRVGRCEIP